ncbi:MAG: NADAR family protein [Lachnospiraceae bacterium]|nr:NADAR family protein [Lachnospiraceae bacterium]
MRYNTQMIVERYNSGETMEFIFFWGHTANPGKTRKACLSQWYACDFEVDGQKYHTTEQFMMAQKALLFGDRDTYEMIMAADNPKDYKALGRLVKNFVSEIWDKNKLEIVVRGNIAKFSQNEALREFLLETGEKVLVEASPYDGIWGVNLGMDDPKIQNPNNWKGENLLGCALMEARDILREKV